MSDPWADWDPQRGPTSDYIHNAVFGNGWEAHRAAIRPDYDRVVAERDAARGEADGYLAALKRTEAERDDALARAEAAEADADRLAEALARWAVNAIPPELHAHDALVAQREGGQ